MLALRWTGKGVIAAAHLQSQDSLHTDELMAEVVAKDTGLRTKRRMSHVGSVALIRG